MARPPEQPPPPVAKGATLAVLVLCSLVLIAHALTFLPFIGDDSLITLRYVQRFLDGEGLTFTDGERVEGYTNFLWVLCNAGMGLLGFDLITGVRVLGVLCMTLALGSVVALFPARRGLSPLPALVGPLTLALAPPIALWTIGGMSPPLYLALLGWSMFHLSKAVRLDSARSFLQAGLLLGLLSLTRADGGLFTVTAVAFLWLRRRSAGELLRVGLPMLVAVGGQMVFRVLYYDDWVPNTAHVKAEPDAARALHGLLHYTAPAALALAGAVALAAVGAWQVARRRDPSRIGALLLLDLAAWTGYVTAVGGDYMPAWRHFCQPLLMAAFLAATAAHAIAMCSPGSPVLGRALWAWPLLLLLLLGQLADGEMLRARTERWEWDGQLVGRFLREAFGDERPLIAVEASGAVPYFSRLPALDLLGLNDRHIARQPARPDLYPPGHDHGDGAYVLDRKPDLALFATPDGAFLGQSLSAVQMQQDPRFASGYRFCQFETDEGFRFGIWARMQGAAGVRRNGEIEVPGHLVGSLHLGRLGGDPVRAVTGHRASPPLVGVAGEDGGAEAELRAESAGLSLLELPPGRYRVTVEQAAGSGLEAVLVDPGSGAELPREGGSIVRVPGDPGGSTAVDLLVRGGAQRPVRFRKVVLEPL